jgi:hypothetical protein
MSLVIGSRMIPFSLPSVDGRNRGPMGGRPTAVVMWCNHCPYVQAWEARLNSIARENPTLDVFAINANDAELQPEDAFPQMVERSRRNAYAFTYLHDETQEVARAYGAERTPEVFLFDREGVLRYHGAIDENWEEEPVHGRYLRDAIEALHMGRDPDPEETPPVGCTIKWRA